MSKDNWTPCDEYNEIPDENGNHYSCPYNSNGSDDCRRHCGVGVDE